MGAEARSTINERFRYRWLTGKRCNEPDRQGAGGLLDETELVIGPHGSMLQLLPPPSVVPFLRAGRLGRKSVAPFLGES